MEQEPYKTKCKPKKYKSFYKVLALPLVVALLVLTGCAASGGSDLPPAKPASAISTAENTAYMAEEGEPIMVEIKMKDGGVILLELDAEAAPQTVDNFTQLVEEEFYDGLIFHRVIKDFMVQGGDPTGTGMGGPGHTIKGEFTSNGWQNPISHQRGVISMARSQKPDSAGSQFFITHGDATFLDGDYAAFGRVVEGMDVVDRIAEVATDGGDRPLEDVVIETIRVVPPAAQSES